MKITKTFFKLFALCLFVTTGGTVEAASIQNLSSQTQTIEVKGESGEYKTVTVDSWRDYSLPGMMRVRLGGEGGTEATIQPDEQFVIWDSKTMGPQRKSGALHN